VPRRVKLLPSAGCTTLPSPSRIDAAPSAGFNVGHAMQRNKVIYALADVALVVSADFEKGGAGGFLCTSELWAVSTAPKVSGSRANQKLRFSRV